MHSDVVLTVTGPDRIGIVETVTGVLLGLGANVETSRMARLGGEFAIIMLAAVPDASAEALKTAFEDLVAEGYRTTVVPTGRETGTALRGWMRYRIEVHGADHEGIVHEIARGLSARGINIEAMDTGTSPAPVTGTTLFSMIAVVAVPPDLAEPLWTADLHEAGRQANVGVVVTPIDAG